MKRYTLVSPDGRDSTEFLEGFEAERDALIARGWRQIDVDPETVRVALWSPALQGPVAGGAETPAPEPVEEPIADDRSRRKGK